MKRESFCRRRIVPPGVSGVSLNWPFRVLKTTSELKDISEKTFCKQQNDKCVDFMLDFINNVQECLFFKC